MNWFPECAPCFLRQVLTVQRCLALDEAQTKSLIKSVGCLLCSIRDDISPPEFAMEVYGKVKELTGEDDPYKRAKEESNRIALSMVPIIRERVNSTLDPIKESVLLSIAGNIIDFGVTGDIDVLRELNQILKEEKKSDPRFFRIDEFLVRLHDSKRILVIGDNCGEIVFDKIMIETIKKHWPDKEFIFAVRGGPIINDVTYDDAVKVGLDMVANIISSGVRAPGAVLSRASKEFISEFYKADMVISKGQGNFEALSDVDREVFFLFMAKCDVVAKFVGCPKGTVLLLRGGVKKSEYK